MEKESEGGLLPSGGRQLLLRDCSGLGRERAGHVLLPWDTSQPSQAPRAPKTERDKGSALSSVKDDFLEKGSVSGAAWNGSRFSVLLKAMGTHTCMCAKRNTSLADFKTSQIPISWLLHRDCCLRFSLPEPQRSQHRCLALPQGLSTTHGPEGALGAGQSHSQ